ncbi:enterochelin esterase-like enzyme [Thermolongibacillus altinsuensis]|uniref:Enterochelin esterase-like enzyme n=2 Tax=Thermolongibacillus altinsuensis TaxID=575256 RepID=A0A4R1QEX0_9BACL|nr:enterochelin esterase-like enzyme [Thermolongibacillus altinsuensis]
MMRELKIKSVELNEEVSLPIHCPEPFTPLHKYVLLIAQDGQDYFMFGKIARVVDRLLAEKRIARTIVVGIPYKDVRDRYSKYHPDGEKHRAYLRFLANELVPFLDQQFPTYQVGAGRILIGDSLAATASLLAALTYPHTFGKVIMQSPYVNDTVLEKVKTFCSPHLLELYHSIGSEETAVKTTDGAIRNFIEPNRQLHQWFVEHQFSCEYREFQGDHSWTYWQIDLPIALEKIIST